MKNKVILSIIIIIMIFSIILFYLSSGKENNKALATKASGSSVVIGADVSHFQGVPIWQQVIGSQQVEFVYLKASEGITYVDPRLDKIAKI